MTNWKEKRREHAYDQCSMVLCHSKSKAILTLIWSLLDTEYGRSTDLSPVATCVVEGDGRESSSLSDTPREYRRDQSLNGSFKSVSNIGVVACNSLNQLSVVFQMSSSTYILTCESSFRDEYAKKKNVYEIWCPADWWLTTFYFFVCLFFLLFLLFFLTQATTSEPCIYLIKLINICHK